LRWRKDIEIQLFIKHGQIALGSGCQQLGGHRRQNSVVACGMITQSMLQRLRHQTGIARTGQQMRQTDEQLIATGKLASQPGANTAIASKNSDSFDSNLV
jgi:hypothetical protein